MSAPKKTQQEPVTKPAPTPKATESRQPVAVRVGDVVLYSMGAGGIGGTQADVLSPMIVTRTFRDDDTIDGVVMCADIHRFANGTGTKPVQQVRKGEGIGQWQPRP